MQEFETRVLNIDKAKIDQKLTDLGAKKTPEVLQKRWTFDFPGRPLESSRAWVRVRDIGDGTIQMAYKCHQIPSKDQIATCEEVELTVENAEKAITFLISIGLEQKSYQETKRTRYELGSLQFDLDEWPMLAPFIEIEGASEQEVMKGVEMLGYKASDTYQGHAGDIYEDEGIKWREMKRITFDA